MSMQTNETTERLDARHRTMLILWGALLLSVVLYFGLSRFMKAPESDGSQSRILTFVLTAMGVLLAISSFAIKQKFVAQAETAQSPALVQTGLIIALALCEMAALLGFIDYMTTGNRYYFVLFIIAVVGMLFHFPRREHLAAASYRKPKQTYDPR